MLVWTIGLHNLSPSCVLLMFHVSSFPLLQNYKLHENGDHALFYLIFITVSYFILFYCVFFFNPPLASILVVSNL